MKTRKVSIGELHDGIKTVQYNAECIEGAVKNAVYEVDEEVYQALYGNKWKEAVKEVASDLFNKN